MDEVIKTVCALLTGLIIGIGPLVWITEKEDKKHGRSNKRRNTNIL